MRLVIAGTDRLTYFLGRTLADRGHHITVVGPARAACEDLARRLDAQAIVGDPTRPEVLEDAGTGSADQVLAVTSEDPQNLVVCQLARMRFRVPRALAMVNDPDNEAVFKALGVEVAFSPIRVLASLIEQSAGLDDVIRLTPAAGGKVLLADVLVSPRSAAAGRPLCEIGMPQGALLGCVVRGGEAFVPHGETVLQPGDRAVVLGLAGVHERAVRLLTAPRR